MDKKVLAKISEKRLTKNNIISEVTIQLHQSLLGGNDVLLGSVTSNTWGELDIVNPEFRKATKVLEFHSEVDYRNYITGASKIIKRMIESRKALQTAMEKYPTEYLFTEDDV